jgi:hypothetical protein
MKPILSRLKVLAKLSGSFEILFSSTITSPFVGLLKAAISERIVL